MLERKHLKLVLIGIIIGLSGLIQSCKDNSIGSNTTGSKKTPTADFSYTTNGGYAPCTVEFTNNSTYAEDYTWDFGDGSSSIAENPSHSFTQPGTYTVTLKVKNSSGQNQKSVQITILRPYTKAKITKIVVNKMPFLDANGSGWDPFDGPDVYLQILSPNPDNTVLVESGQIANLLSSQLPISWTLTTPYTISDFINFYFIQFMDYDTLDNDDTIDYVSFKLEPYTIGNNAFPSSISKSQNNSTITIYLTWTY